MCTVTLSFDTTSKKAFVLTSNRDEARGRISSPPEFHLQEGVKLLYPKDIAAGGTWIGVSELNRMVCLLNGGFHAHKREKEYRKSRGVVVKDFLTALNMETVVEKYDLNNIEPFTMITGDWKNELQCMELVWDGRSRHVKHLDLTTHLWSSSPLYDAKMKEQREAWFVDFQRKYSLKADKLWEFHHSAGIGDPAIDLIMDRGFVKTQSITQIINTETYTKMRYEDLRDMKITETRFAL
ncbi:NRDE family protein [Gillisia sp. M10.2A]|uniref:NRDE family protein n=1 Tax=Gillisia lutea TaxID=2909668 RepID=A0ABS9EHN4_9FLAO|nr:NRDE family protein [Gillisia lutea]MCF4102379.1 NRDE family protein [Gillisia lutea]